MTKKHRLRESIKSFFGSHVDPEKDEQRKGTKKEIEDKVRNILKLLKDEDREGKDENAVDNSKLVDLVEDLHGEYQSLYSLYDHLTGEIKNKVRGKQGKESFSSSSSDSDSDTNISSKHNGFANGIVDGEVTEVTYGIKQELKKANQEVIELKEKLKATGEEITVLKQDNRTLVPELEAARGESKKLKKEVEEKVFGLEARILELEAISSDKAAEISGLLKTNEGLVAEVDSLQNQNTDLEEQIKRKSLESDTLRYLKEELHAKTLRLEEEMECLCYEKNKLEEKIRIISHETDELKAEKEVLLGKVSDMERMLTEKTDELIVHQRQLQDRETEQVELIHNQKSELELQIEKYKQESSDQKRMMEEKEAEYKILSEEYKKVESRIEKYIAEFKFLEIKAEEMTESKNKTVFDLEGKVKKVGDLERKVVELERAIEEAKREAEAKVDEMTESKNKTVVDLKGKVKTIGDLERKVIELERAVEEAKLEADAQVDEIKTLKEDADRTQDSIRLERRQFTVTKQTLAAEEEEVRRLKEEQRALEARISELVAKIAADEEEHTRVIKDLSEKVNITFSGHESLFEQWVGDFENFAKRFYKILEEIKPAKLWAEAKIYENLVLKKKVGELNEQLQGWEEEKAALRETVGKLEAQKQDEEVFKENLLRNLREHEETINQMKEEFIDLSEQKRQAIRHISEWAEAKFVECNMLKGTISRMRGGRTRI